MEGSTPMDGGNSLVADAGAPADSDDQAWGPWVPSGPTGVPVISAASATEIISMTSTIAQSMAAATRAQPMAPPPGVPQIKYAASENEGGRKKIIKREGRVGVKATVGGKINKRGLKNRVLPRFRKRLGDPKMRRWGKKIRYYIQ